MPCFIFVVYRTSFRDTLFSMFRQLLVQWSRFLLSLDVIIFVWFIFFVAWLLNHKSNSSWFCYYYMLKNPRYLQHFICCQYAASNAGASLFYKILNMKIHKIKKILKRTINTLKCIFFPILYVWSVFFAACRNYYPICFHFTNIISNNIRYRCIIKLQTWTFHQVYGTNFIFLCPLST